MGCSKSYSRSHIFKVSWLQQEKTLNIAGDPQGLRKEPLA